MSRAAASAMGPGHDKDLLDAAVLARESAEAENQKLRSAVSAAEAGATAAKHDAANAAMALRVMENSLASGMHEGHDKEVVVAAMDAKEEAERELRELKASAASKVAAAEER